jgi:hypothetical protein
MKKYRMIKFTVLIFLAAVTMTFTFAEKGGKGSTTSHKTQLIAGDSYDLYVNNIDLPIERNGILADVLIPPAAIAGGKLQNKIFLYSGGFFMSGITKGKIWANGELSASRITDYVPGTYAGGINDSRAQIYIVKSTDQDFGQSWQDWKTAVDLGADFYDGDGDGIYNPVDKNGNGKWDPNEDRPDILGDVTVWCVYSDQEPSALRTFNEVNPQGIEVRQTVFAFNSKGKAGNTIFIRYKIVNTGFVADTLDDVYFSVGADADVGDNGALDLVGCDTTLNAGFTYHTDATSAKWGATPPCFLIDFFQGPKAYIPGVTFKDVNGNGVYDDGVDIAIDTATNVRGRVLGVQKFPGAKNLGLSSFLQYYNGIDPLNSQQLRDYTLGEDNTGSKINPCTWTQGSVLGGVVCAQVDPNFMYSGDPVTNIGWINNTPRDQRQISNTGPFKLISRLLPSGKRANDTITIVAAYVIGQGTSGFNSVTVAKNNDVTAQSIFDANFPSLPPPPAVAYNYGTGDGFIDINWPTSKNILYKATDSIFQVSRNVHGFYITQYFTNAQAATNNNQPNSQVIARYDLRDSIGDIYYKVANGGVDLRMPQAPLANKLDSLLVADPTTGRIDLRVTTDAATGNPLIKGHEYYFSITEYTVNNWAVVNKSSHVYGPGNGLGAGGDYYDSTGNAVEEFESPLITVTMGTDEYLPTLSGAGADKSNGPSSGSVRYVVVDKTKLTGDKYKIDFTADTNPLDGLYNPYWTLTNMTTGAMLVDSSRIFNFDTTSYTGVVVEGILPKVQPLTPTIGLPIYLRNGNVITDTTAWFNPIGNSLTAFPSKIEGVYYVGKDIPQSGSFSPITTASNVIETADRLRKVEIRFGDTCKAYRYLNGFQGANILSQRGSNVYAGGITAADTTPVGGVRRGTVGNWDSLATPSHANGFVTVPFTAWDVDSANHEQKQLAVGFFERRANFPGTTAFGGNPDGIWDPKDSVYKTWEVIMVFDAPYDPTGSQIEYTGNATKWADPVKGFTLDPTIGASAKQIAIAKSPWFNALYVVALDRYHNKFYQNGDKFVIPVNTYPYTSTDEFQFTTLANGSLTAADKKSLFDKINVFPNPLYGYNPQTSYQQNTPDEPWVTFSNLPEQVTINIFTLSGTRLRTLTTNDKASPTSTFLKWDLKNEAGLRAASGMYLAIVSAPGFGEKILKFAIIMPQKQIKSY